ncbi:unnamed protein product, partial [Timema podura]|nr:unnamed protein product [Timema podura]
NFDKSKISAVDTTANTDPVRVIESNLFWITTGPRRDVNAYMIKASGNWGMCPPNPPEVVEAAK